MTTFTTIPRTRSRVLVEPKTLDTNYVSWNFQNQPYVCVSEGKAEEMTDWVVPGYHKLIKDGEVINNPCNYTVTSWEAEASDVYYCHWPTSTPAEWWKLDSGNLTLRHLMKGFTFNLWDKPYLPLPSFDTASASKTKCLADVDSTPYEFFEDLAEVRETIEFLRNPLQGLADLSKVYKKRKRNIERRGDSYNPKWDRKAEAKALASLWNQYQFAAAPLVRSCLTALEAWNERENLRRPKRRSAHGYSRSRDTGWQLWQKLAQFSECFEYRRDDASEVFSHATIYYEVDNPLMDWKFALGLRLKDVPTTMWQIMPLSFMVDRLVNVQHAIAGLINLHDPSVTFLAASLTRRYTQEWTISLERKWHPFGTMTFAINRPDKVNFLKFTYDRDLWTPSVRDTIPPVTWDGLTSDIVKTTDLIALTLSFIL